MVPLLEKLGFADLTLISTDGKTTTFSFGDWSQRLLINTLGKPSITSNNKVVVFTAPHLGRLGIAPSVARVRVIVEVADAAPKAGTGHLAGTKIPPAYLKALEKAQVTPTLRLAWMTKMWEWFNENKFGGRMTIPKFELRQQGGAHKTSRGIYFGGPYHAPGRLYLAPFLFNARPPFILEVFLHEMCHQAVWTLDRVLDSSGTQGHGPQWQAWMRKVGLDPRRFDPTEDVEYMSRNDAVLKDLKDRAAFGKRVSESFWTDKVKVNTAFTGNCWLRYKERALETYVAQEKTGFEFRFKTPKGKSMSLAYKTWPVGQVYVEKS